MGGSSTIGCGSKKGGPHQITRFCFGKTAYNYIYFICWFFPALLGKTIPKDGFHIFGNARIKPHGWAHGALRRRGSFTRSIFRSLPRLGSPGSRSWQQLQEPIERFSIENSLKSIKNRSSSKDSCMYCR